MSSVKVSIVVAMANNNVIGINNSLPWRLPEDLKRFKQLTLGHPIVMGRKTFDSIGKALPGRANIVVTRDLDLVLDDAVIMANSLDDALAKAEVEAVKADVDQIMVIGGANFYQQVLPIAEHLYVTQVDANIEGDAFFPEFDLSDWQVVTQDFYAADEKNQFNMTFLTLQKYK